MREGWELKKLGDVCISASSNVSQNKLADEEGEFPIFGASGVIKNVSFYHRDKPYLSIVKDGSGFGRITKMDAFTSVIGTLQYILPKENIDLDYLHYSLMSVDFKKYVAGAAIPHIYFKDYKNEPFLWMPLSEQQRIVVILDEAFAAIAKAKANTEQNLKNAKELFESYLQGVFENKGEGWEEKTLGEVAKFSQGIQVGLEHHISEPKNGYVRFIRIIDYTQETEDIRFVPDPGQKYFVNKDDVVMVRYGSPGMIGRGKEGVIANNLFKITIEKTGLSNDFLCLCLSQKHIQSFLSTQGSATMPALNFGQLKNVLIDFPSSIEEQHSIVRQLDALRTETQRLEAVYQQKLADFEELKKSILQKAFAGELTYKSIAS
uniref:restriction endonuclease subunit S n=1 Tax=Algoriphagus sp. TaxID=1872435 RepID=UPI0040478FFF